MNKLLSAALLFTGLALGTFCKAQDSFNSCSAGFVVEKMVVTAYTPTGKCQLPANATGTITVKPIS